jgi:flavin reductase
VIEPKTYREAMARLGAAVNVITTDGPAGRRGFTASSVCSVTDAPPTLLVCLNRTSDSNAAVKGNGILCVNTLSAAQQHLSPVFAGMIEGEYAERFDRAQWGTLATGAPVLGGALVSFDCRVAQVTEIGTHSVFFCEVVAVHTADDDDGGGLIYFRRCYHKVHAA